MVSRREMKDTLLGMLKDAGAEITGVEYGAHEKVRYRLNGQNRTLIIPISASDWRAVRNAVAYLRRTLRELSMLSTDHAQKNTTSPNKTH